MGLPATFLSLAWTKNAQRALLSVGASMRYSDSARILSRILFRWPLTAVLIPWV
jgi:hypothetical protein